MPKMPEIETEESDREMWRVLITNEEERRTDKGRKKNLIVVEVL